MFYLLAFGCDLVWSLLPLALLSCSSSVGAVSLGEDLGDADAFSPLEPSSGGEEERFAFVAA